jgi:hypothetical protein
MLRIRVRTAGLVKAAECSSDSAEGLADAVRGLSARGPMVIEADGPRDLLELAKIASALAELYSGQDDALSPREAP